jgi:hypothetical protein
MSLHQRITDLRAAGLTLAQIGKHVRLNASTVQYHLRNRGCGLPEGRGHNSHGAPPTPDEMAAELAQIRAAERARLAARPPEQSKAERRKARLAVLHPLVAAAVVAATAGNWDDLEKWKDGE